MPKPARSTVCFGRRTARPMPRRKRSAERKDQRIRQVAAEGAVPPGLHLRRARKSISRIGVDIGEVVILLRIGREEFVAHAVIQRQVRKHAPIVLRVRIEYVVAQIALVTAEVKRCVLRQAQQEIGERRAGVGSCAASSVNKPENVKVPGRIRAAQENRDAPAESRRQSACCACRGSSSAFQRARSSAKSRSSAAAR